MQINIHLEKIGDFPGGPVAKTPNAGCLGFDPSGDPDTTCHN